MTDRSAVSLAVSTFGAAEDPDEEPDPSRRNPLPFATERASTLVAALEKMGYTCSTPETRSSSELNEAVLHAIETGPPDSIRIIHLISHGHLGETGALHVVGADGEYRHANVEAWLQRVVEKQDAAP